MERTVHHSLTPIPSNLFSFYREDRFLSQESFLVLIIAYLLSFDYIDMTGKTSTKKQNTRSAGNGLSNENRINLQLGFRYNQRTEIDS
jgi:hypothetical protein